MRKDVRMGFAVGGVLLAVIIVAVLVVHRNKNQNKSVTIDLTGKSAPAEGTGEVDVAPPGSASTSGKRAESPQPPADQPKGAPDDHAKVKDRTGQDSGDAGDAGDKWNQLFVSTAADPIKEMSANHPKPKQQPPADDSEASHTAVTDLRGAGDVNPLSSPQSIVTTCWPIRPRPPARRRAAPRREPTASRRTRRSPRSRGWFTGASGTSRRFRRPTRR